MLFCCLYFCFTKNERIDFMAFASGGIVLFVIGILLALAAVFGVAIAIILIVLLVNKH